MKKLLLLLAAVGLLQFLSIVYYDTKMLDRPVPVAGLIDFTDHSIRFSYITNSSAPHTVHFLELNGNTYYPNEPFSMFAESGQVEHLAKYRYYSVVSAEIPLFTEEEIQPFDQPVQGTIHFMDGATAPIRLTAYSYEETPQLQSLSFSIGSHGTAELYKALVPFTVNRLTIADDRVDVLQFKINGEDMPLPLTSPLHLNKDDKIWIETSDGIARYKMEPFQLELQIAEGQQDGIITLSRLLNIMPSEDWVTRQVKESGEQ